MKKKQWASRFSELLFWSRNPYSLLCSAGLLLLRLLCIMDCSTFFVWREVYIPKYNSLLFFALYHPANRKEYIVQKECMEISVLWGFFSAFALATQLCIFCPISLENLLVLLPPPFLLNWDSNHVVCIRNLHLSPVTKWCQNCRGYITFFRRRQREKLPANVRHIENVLKVVSFLLRPLHTFLLLLF